ncbi:PREDICTED: uncharacterized protein LOC105364525, partial [Ceratosolen solmsi marchali]|uniref:Uncharacterized protein LOC105364525 n=1 Tax=Ceratosolen solmsi marchali TaxID=326594 RepID=A0AAJ7DY75_9HYME
QQQQQHQQQQQQQQQQPHQSVRNQEHKPWKNCETNQTTNVATKIEVAAAAACRLRIQKGPKPLKNKTFYLDIKNHAHSAKLEAKIKELGGGIELFLVKNVTLVITDRSDKSAQGTAGDKRKWGYASGGSGGPPSLRSIEIQTPTPTPPTPYCSVEGPLSNSTNQRGQTTHRSKSRVDAMLERALIQPQQCSVDPLDNALNWGLPIWSTYELQAWLDKITASLKDTHTLKRDNRTVPGKDLKVRHLKAPYIKFESYRRDSRPVFLELQSWPTLNFDGEPGSCPFDLKRKESKETTSNNKEIKENREKYFIPNISKGKDMTRRPRATATRARKTENTGYCEICRIDYRNLSKHLQSDQHLNFVRNDKNFLSLDNLINTGASVEAFLEINRSKDVSKDCNLFPSRDHSLDNGILSLDEKSEKRDKSSNLNDFNIEEMKMIQCNGARRNLNLKLDSPHNLRTRAKHESGHLLRSKGRPWHEDDKSEKLYDKYTIKKRAKGTIWIEEDDSEDDKDVENSRDGCDGKSLFQRICEPEINKNATNRESLSENVSVNGDIASSVVDCKLKEHSLSKITNRDNTFRDSLLEENFKTKINGYDRKEEKLKLSEILHSAESQELKEVNHVEFNVDSLSRNTVDNNTCSDRLPTHDIEDINSLKSLSKDDRGRYKLARRGGRSYRGRQRLSVEERLIEDNRDYYKVEVLGNKLRSSAISNSNVFVSPLKEQLDRAKKDEKPSSEKPVVVRFKRVRKSELSLLSDEAESFMFGDSRRDDDSSETSDGEQSSVLPKDTESDRDDTSFVLSSSPTAHITPKQEVIEDDQQDSSLAGRARKRRRTQTEALIMDNNDYYKFETPGSRLRYQAPLTGICDPVPDKDAAQPLDPNTTEVVEKIYPSKPSPEVEKMHFSFEAVPKSEPWYQTYQRQDEGAEFWHYFSESDTPKPFLLPYEIENFHEILHKSLQSSVYRKRGRSRGGHVNMGSRSPRKSPRCHASTLAIMSTIIRRREQQQTTTLTTVDEEVKVKQQPSETVKLEKKLSDKSDVDEDLKEIVKNLDDMLSSNDMHDMDSFEVDLLKNVDDAALESDVLPKGAPVNLLELLDNCHDTVPPNGIENSSCASSECGELYNEFPMKRRKKRKNKTGWPGNKMRRKLHIKHLSEELQRELDRERSMERNEMKLSSLEFFEDSSSQVSHEDEANDIELETGKENERVLNTYERRGSSKPRRPKARMGNKEYRRDHSQESSEIRNSDDMPSKMVLKSVFGDDISPRKNRSGSADKYKVDDDDVETRIIKDSRHLEGKGTLSSISEDSEASLSNNENLCTKDTNSLMPRDKHLPLRYTRKSTTSSEASHHHSEAENRRHGGIGSATKKQQKDVGATRNLPINVDKRSRRKSKKYQRNDRTPSKAIFDNENCKKSSFLSLKERRLKRVRREVSVSSELPNGELDCALAERVSPSLVSSSDVDQRRSSIDFQPVVRVMKIEDQVDMDNSILSVAVASNRRLRSSSSPRSNMQPPNKRFRNGSGRRQFSSQWIKNS